MSLLRDSRSHTVRTRVAASAAALVVFLIAPMASADGAASYKANCASCHGADGKSDTPVGKAMKVPQLAGETHSLEDVTATIRGNSKHKSASGKVSDDDLAAITEFLKTL